MEAQYIFLFLLFWLC